MSKKKVIFLIMIFIFFIISIIGVYYFTTKKNEQELNGKVIISGDTYIIIEANNKDYLIKDIKGSYEIGDEVLITYNIKDKNDLSSPIEIFAIKEVIIKKALKEENKYEQNNNIPNEQDNIDNNLNETTNYNENTIKNETTYQNSNDNKNENDDNEIVKDNKEITTDENADIEVLNYVKSIENDINNGETKTLKNGFITIIDFLFYNGNIKGHTFDELTNKAKLEVLKAALLIDEKVEEIFPNYKENISNEANKTYTNVKNSVISTYLNITTNICNENSELCENAKQDFQSLKNNFDLTWEFIKDLAGNGISKLKEYYEIWSDK